jgi:hypothetical protein
LACSDIGILKNNMDMGVMRISACVVVGSTPGNAALAEIDHEILDGLVTLFRRQFNGEGNGEPVGNPAAFGRSGRPVEFIKVSSDVAAFARHVLGLKFC